MIERKIVAEKLKEKSVSEFIYNQLGRLNASQIKLKRTPLGEKITVYTSRPGVIVGKKGNNIRDLTLILKKKFKMENPQIEVVEVENPNLDASSVARAIVLTFERYGPKRFKAIAYKTLENIIKAGARGAEIVIAGRGVPGERAKTWRFSAGYLKKSGDISANFMDRCSQGANLKSGTVGIKVSILRPEIVMPDEVKLINRNVSSNVPTNSPSEIVVEEITEESSLSSELKSEKKKSKKRSKKETNLKSNKEVIGESVSQIKEELVEDGSKVEE